jgi:hypothetical protein
MRRSEKDVFLSPSKGHHILNLFIGHQAWNLSLATKLGTFHWPLNLEPSIGHQAWNLSLAIKLGTFHWPLSIRTFHWPPNTRTFHWPPNIGTVHRQLSWGLFHFFPFFFFLRHEFGSFWAFFFRHHFQFEY